MKPKDEDGRLNVRMSKDLLKRLKVACAQREVAQQQAAQEAILAWLKGASR